MARTYYVHMIDDKPVLVYGPYALSSAKSYARIGSQTGGRRVVTKGEQGRAVRVYESGYRKWPRGRAAIQQAGLTRAETPKEPTPYVTDAVRRRWRREGIPGLDVSNPRGIWVEPSGEPGIYEVHSRWDGHIGYIYSDDGVTWTIRYGMDEQPGYADFEQALVDLKDYATESGRPTAPMHVAAN